MAAVRTEKDVKVRIGKAAAVFGKMKKTTLVGK